GCTLNQLADDLPSHLVVGVRLAGEDELHPAALEQRLDALEIVEDQVAALVGGGATGEADGEDGGIEAHAAAGGDEVEQLGLQVLAGRPPALRRCARLRPA